MSPDESVFREHIKGGTFQSGVDSGRWMLISIQWPYAVMAISAAPREGGPKEYELRFELTNYPQTPTAQPWDSAKNAPLEFEKRPTGKSRVAMAFKTDWEGGRALYLPCDRVAIKGHDGWCNQHPSMIWSPKGNITQYLRIVSELLNSSDYTGPRSPWPQA
jgi:hypothetical protein